MGYVFISYSSRNQSSADAMHDYLNKQGIDTWMAPGDIPAGSRYAQVINQALKECACFLLMLSEDAQNSIWVTKEVERAINYKKPIIPVQLEDVILNDEFELYISTDQIVAVRKIDPDSAEMKKLLSSVVSYAGRRDTASDSGKDPSTFNNILKKPLSQKTAKSESDSADLPQERIHVGSIIDGKYRVTAMLGQGIFSEVYLAQNINTDKKWTIKVINRNDEKYDTFVSRVSSEISIMNHLSHPALPSIADLILTNDQLLVVMDYIEGKTLSEFIAGNGAQSEYTVLIWARQLCDVLGYLHRQEPKIIHNDIHPNNIMLTSDGRIMLIDFGSAIKSSQTTENNGPLLGTTFFTAPEKYTGMIDERTDIYALGMTLYTLLTGKDPSLPPYTLFPLRKVNPELSQEFEHIIAKCMERDPACRYQNTEELLADLNKIDKTSSKPKKPGVIRRLFSRK